MADMKKQKIRRGHYLYRGYTVEIETSRGCKPFWFYYGQDISQDKPQGATTLKECMNKINAALKENKAA